MNRLRGIHRHVLLHRMSRLLAALILLCGCGAAMQPASAAAPESRTWLSTNGTMLEASLVRATLDSVELRAGDGRTQTIPRAQLSFGDNEFLQETAPKPDAAGGTGGKPAAKLPNPGKEIKINIGAFKLKSGEIKILNRTWQVCETPHFKVLHQPAARPGDIGELAERLWFDTAFFHRSFLPKWQGRKMGILLANDEAAYNEAGEWYAGMLKDAGDLESPERIRKTWPESATGVIELPQAQAESFAMFTRLRVFRAYEPPKTPRGKPQPIKGVWDPLRTNSLAADMLNIHAGTMNLVASDGIFAIFTGYAYHKEILLNGHSDTALLHTEGTGRNVAGSGGFDTGKPWAAELKKKIRQDDTWKPSLLELMTTGSNDGRTKDIVFAWAFARFLQSTPERMSAFTRLCIRIDEANQVPDPEEIARLYGHTNATAFATAWEDWMKSAEFR